MDLARFLQNFAEYIYIPISKLRRTAYMTTHLLELQENRFENRWFASSIGIKRFTFVHVPIEVAEMGDKYTSKCKILYKRDF